MSHIQTVSQFGSTFNPIHLVILLALLAAVVAAVVLVLRRIFRWVRRRLAESAAGPN